MRRITALVLAMGLLAMLFAAGCGDSKSGPASNERPRDELVMAIGGEPDDGFDPTTGWGRYGSPLFQSTLLKRDNDLNIVNDLATGYTRSEDGLVWTFPMRQDVKFSDGEALTADDVVYTYETAAASGSVLDLNVMQRVRAVDSYTVEFVLKQPQSTFINIAASLGIVPRHAHNSQYKEHPIGSGPYKFVQWDKGQQLIVEVNPEYYGTKPAFKKISFLYLNEEAAFAAAQAGEVDVAGLVPALARQAVPGMKLLAVDSVDNRGICFPCTPSGSFTKNGEPVGNDVTADPAIRKAINYAVDRQSLVDGVLLGYGSPAYSVCDNMPWWNPDVVIKDADLETAGKTLAEGGWADLDGDGILEKGALRAEFTLLYPSSDQTRQSLAVSAADMVKPLGISIKVEGKSWDDIYKLAYSNAILYGWGSHDPLEMYNLYYSGSAGNESYNAGFYSNPVVDGYLNQALAAPDENSANEYWKKAQWDGQTGLSVRGDAPWAWLVNLDHLYLVKDKLNTGKNRIEPHGHGWPITANIEEWHWE